MILRIEDLQIGELSIGYIRLGKSKTDQELTGRQIQISHEAQIAFACWIKFGKLIFEGYLPKSRA